VIGGWFKKKKKDRIEQSEERVELPFSTDLHSHLIPGIDDGVKTLQESLGLLKGLEELGYRRIYTTPHIMSDSYRNSSATIREGLADLRRSATEKGLTLEIDAAAEYYLDELLFERLEQGDILTIGRDLLLFETSYYNEPLQLEERIYEISARGYRPLMAHPERYRYVKDPEKFYGRLRSLGVSFQVNINSLGGYYGSDAREKAVWLARRGWIDYLGSDMHGARQLEFLRKSFKNKAFYEAIDNNNVLNDIIL
jgi:protein-tyrosine phosphatase